MFIFVKDLILLGGGSLLNLYDKSISKVLKNVFPQYSWNLATNSRNFWGDSNNHRKWMDWAGNELKIKEMSDWYKVSVKVIKDCFVCMFIFYSK